VKAEFRVIDEEDCSKLLSLVFLVCRPRRSTIAIEKIAIASDPMKSADVGWLVGELQPPRQAMPPPDVAAKIAPFR
jgi:hypothetical protein